jgi:hypothetical protein
LDGSKGTVNLASIGCSGRWQLAPNRYAGHRFPPEIISHAVWLYFRFPLSLRMIEEMLAARTRAFKRLGRDHRRCRGRLTTASTSPPRLSLVRNH